jgi:hypothetical protein
LKTNGETDVKFAHDVNKIGALAFLSSGEVRQGFDDHYSSLRPLVETSLDYFEKNYGGRRRSNEITKLQFTIGLWNMRERTLSSVMQTNNNAEA